jgi:hypothetical protein
MSMVLPKSPGTAPADNPILAEMQSILADQRQRLARLRDSSYMRRFSESSSKQRHSMVVGMLHSSLRTQRRWNQELQWILDGGNGDSLERRRAQVNKLLADFRVAAKRVARDFIEQKHFGEPAADLAESANASRCDTPIIPDPVATSPPGTTENCPLDGPNGASRRSSLAQMASATVTSSSEWAAAADEASGLAFRVSICENPTVAKRAGKEVSLQLQLLSLLLDAYPSTPPPVTVYPSCTCSYAGYTVCVSAVPGRAGPSFDASVSPELALVLDYAGEALNVSKYDCLTDEGKEVERVGPPTASAFEGADGRIYIDTILGFFPPSPPARGNPVTVNHTLFLRPEVVLTNPGPVSPGAFVTFGGTRGPRLKDETTKCAQRLCGEIVPRIAKELVTSPPADAVSMIASRLKPSGVNVALLGLLLYHIPAASAHVRSIVFTEMIARAARTKLEETPGDGSDAVMDAFKEKCAELCNPETQSAAMEELLPTLHQKFAGSATLLGGILKLPSTLFNRNTFVQRLAKLHGMVLSRGVNGTGTSAFHFSVERMFVRCPEVRLGPSIDQLVARLQPIKDPLESRESLPHKPLPTGLDIQYHRSQSLRSENGAAAAGAAGDDFVKRLNDVPHRRSLRSGKASFAYRYELYLVGARLRGTHPDRALHFLTQSLELSEATSSGGATVARCLCERAATLLQLRRYAEAERDLDDATDLLSHKSPAGGSSPQQSSHRFFAAFDENQRASAGTSQNASPAGSMRADRSTTNANATAVRMFALLASLHEQMHCFDQAEPSLRHVLAIQKALYGEVHPAVAAAWGALGYNLVEQGQSRQNEAENALREDIHICRLLYGDLSPQMATSVGNLAFLLSRQERFTEAVELHRLDVEITAATAGEDSLDLATSRINLGVALCRSGQLVQAKELLEAGLRAKVAALGSEDTSVASAMANVAHCLILLYKRDSDHTYLDAAEQHALTAVGIVERSNGYGHGFLRVPLDHLLAIYTWNGETAKAAAARTRLEAVVAGETPDRPFAATLPRAM